MEKNLQQPPLSQGIWCTLFAIEVLLLVTRGPFSCQACLKKDFTRLIFFARPQSLLWWIWKLDVVKPDRLSRHTELPTCQHMPLDCHALTPPHQKSYLSPRAEVASKEAAGSEVGYCQKSVFEHPNSPLRANYLTYAVSETCAVTSLGAVELIPQSWGLLGSFHPSLTCGACGNFCQCSRNLTHNLRGLPHRNLVACQKIVPMEAPKAAVHVPVTVAVRNAYGMNTVLEQLVLLEAMHLG